MTDSFTFFSSLSCRFCRVRPDSRGLVRRAFWWVVATGSGLFLPYSSVDVKGLQHGRTAPIC